MNVAEKYVVAPYKAMELTKKAQTLVSKLVNDATTFTKPYTESKVVMEIAMCIINKNIELFEEDKK